MSARRAPTTRSPMAIRRTVRSAPRQMRSCTTPFADLAARTHVPGQADGHGSENNAMYSCDVCHRDVATSDVLFTTKRDLVCARCHARIELVETNERVARNIVRTANV